jgi:hypothetical protein
MRCHAPGVAVIDRLLDVREEHSRVAVKHLAVREHVALTPVEQLPRILPIDGAVEEVEHEPLHVFRRIDPQPVHPNHLDQPLRVAHQIAGRVLDDRIARHRVLEVEAVDRDVTLIRPRIEHEDRAVPDVRIESPIPRVRQVGQSSELRRGSRRQISRIPGGHGVTNEPMILLVRDVDQPGQPLVVHATRERGMEVAIDIGGERDGQPRITAGLRKSSGSQIREPAVIDDEIHVQAQARTVQQARERLQTFFGPVQGWPSRRSEIEAVVGVVPDAARALVGPTRRRQPDEPVSCEEHVRQPLFDRLVGRLEPLKDRRRRIVGARGYFRGR